MCELFTTGPAAALLGPSANSLPVTRSLRLSSDVGCVVVIHIFWGVTEKRRGAHG